jgi:signal recognition particle subunit SEC65
VNEDLVARLRKRAEIRRQIPGRKSVQEGKPDRIADILEEAAIKIEDLDDKNDHYRKAINEAYDALGQRGEGLLLEVAIKNLVYEHQALKEYIMTKLLTSPEGIEKIGKTMRDARLEAEKKYPRIANEKEHSPEA